MSRPPFPARAGPHVLAAVLLALLLSEVVLAPAPVAAQRRTRRRKPVARTAKIIVASLTEGAEIYIDGELVATVPMDSPIEMAPGEHVIKVTKAGYADLFETIDFPASFEPRVVEADLFPVSGVVDIGSTPPGANVVVDGEFRGQTPLSGTLEEGTRNLSITLAGYDTFTEQVEIIAGETYHFEPTLHVAELEKFYETWWFWTGVATVVAASAITAVAISSDPPTTRAQSTDGSIDLRTLQLSR